MQGTKDTRAQSLGRGDPLEKGKATHSSVLAWKIPWAEEPSGLQSLGWQSGLSNYTHTHTHTHSLSLSINDQGVVQASLQRALSHLISAPKLMNVGQIFCRINAVSAWMTFLYTPKIL